MRSAPVRIAAAIGLLLTFAAYGQAGPPSGPPVGTAGCSFDPTGRAGLNFTLDPSSGSPVTVTATLLVGDCASGRTMTVSVDNGIRGDRTIERVGGTERITYRLSAPTFGLATASGPGIGAYKAVSFTLTVDAYMDAMVGLYYDRLTVTVAP